MSKTHSVIKSFPYAFKGIKNTLINEPNFRIQSILAILAIMLGLFFHLTSIEWLILTISIFLVLIMELINTTLENLVDIISPEIQDKAGIAKDVAAAGVLLSSLLSLIVGTIIFLPKAISLLFPL